MKKIFNFFILFAFISLAIQSCQMKENDIFGEDPATRQDNWMAEYRRVFNNNEFGWALYTDNPTYGRHPCVNAYAVKFDQGNCTFYNSMSTRKMSNAKNLDSVVSQYSFKMDNGIVLSFDTYNTFFHYYADQSQYFSQDLQSDFEFCLDRFSANEDTIFGRGKTKQLPFFMVKMKLPAEEYQQKSDNVSNYAAYNCIMICEGDTMQARFLSGYNNLLVYFPDSVGGSNVEHLYSYGNLTNGIYLLENFKYKKTNIVEMDLNESTGEFKDINSNAKIGPRPCTDYLTKDASDEEWFFGYSGLGSYTQTEWNKSKDLMKEKGIVNPDNQHYICLHPDGHGGLSLMFNEWFGSDEVTYPMEMKKISNNELAFRWTGKENSGRKYSFYDNGYKYIVDAFAKTDSWTTYKITYKSGNAMSPVSFILTDESNPDNSICFEHYYRYYNYSIWQ